MVHFSLTTYNAGYEDWKDLNAGLIVIEPRKELFNTICQSINKLLSDDGSDQGFLHSLYPEWRSQTGLHLDHRFNSPYCYLDEYCLMHAYQFDYKRRKLNTNIAVIHYWGRHKPWDISPKTLKRTGAEKWEQSLFLWWDTFLSATS